MQGARPRIPPAPVIQISPHGNLLSTVAPPTALPNFVSPTPVAVVNPAASNELHQQSKSSDAERHNPTEDDFATAAFSPAIPPSKGEPTTAIRSPDSSQATTAPTSLSTSSPTSDDIDQLGNLVGTVEVASTEVEMGNPMPGSGLFIWMKGAVSSGGLLARVAEKAKSSVDSMITTLDPQMKEYIYSGGDTEVIVASEKEEDVATIREAFQTIFGKATVVGLSSIVSNIATQPVGFPAGLAAAKEKIAYLRSTNQKINNNTPIVAVDNIAVEVVTDRWYDVSALVLTQPSIGITLETFSQMTSIPSSVIAAAKADTPTDYINKETGFSNTITSYMATNLQVPQNHWHETASGVSRREILLLAAKSLAGSYKKMLALSCNSFT